MNVLTEFKIPYLGLKDGQHSYEFKIGLEFFTLLGRNDIEGADFNVEVLLDKKTSMIVADISFEGTFECPCDRCNDLASIFLDGDEKIIYKLGAAAADEDDESIVELPSNVGHLDLAPQVFEVITVHMPLRVVHESEEECNQEVIKKLQALKPKVNINSQWEELLKLKSE